LNERIQKVRIELDFSSKVKQEAEPFQRRPSHSR